MAIFCLVAVLQVLQYNNLSIAKYDTASRPTSQFIFFGLVPMITFISYSQKYFVNWSMYDG